MKNEETGRISYYTSKKEVVYTSLMMCENVPPEWQIVLEENIKRFQKSVRYKRSEDKEATLEKFKITFQKQRLWNEVLKIEKNADAQLGRSFEFALPKEWNRQEQIQYTTDYIQKTFVDRGMCADWSIHDKGDGNPHVHLLLTMRPFNPDHSWGKKEVKDWDFVLMGKTLGKELKQALHPQVVAPVRMDGKLVNHETIRTTNVFLAAYIFIFAASFMLVSLDGFDMVTNFTSIAATLNNIGPGLNQVGPMMNFGAYSNFAKLVLIFDMLAGRLEIFPMLVLFLPDAWRRF